MGWIIEIDWRHGMDERYICREREREKESTGGWIESKQGLGPLNETE